MPLLMKPLIMCAIIPNENHTRYGDSGSHEREGHRPGGQACLP
jgi:hypothetical protein